MAQYPMQFHKSFSEWKNHLESFSAPAKAAQVLVFPEYGAMDLTSLLPEADRALSRQIPALQTFLSAFLETFEALAKKNQQLILSPSFPVLDRKISVNRAFLFGPQGLVGFQDKYKMTRFENEDWHVSGSPHPLICFETEFGNMGVSLCYDVEFPQFAKTLAQAGAQYLLAPSCTETLFGLNRVHIGARARALENQFYVAVASTVGEAPWSPAVDFNTGQALLCGPPDLGFPEDGVVARGVLNKPGWTVADMDLQFVESVRKQGSVLNFKDSFESRF